MRPFLPLRGAVGRADGDIAVEVGGGEQELGRRAVGQVGDGGRGDVAAPAILDGHGDAQRHAQIAGLPGLVRPPNLLIFRLTTSIADRLGRAAAPRCRRCLVQDERMIGMPADGETFLVAQAGLLDVDIDIVHGRAPRGGRRA